MTKKHFISLADTLIEVREKTVWNALTLAQFNATVDAIADYCQSQNPRFNRERWLAYIAGECGPNGGKL